jgi:hypothetical protein
MSTEYWPFLRGADPSHKWAEIAKHLYFTHIDWRSNHAATAHIVGVLARALQ